MIRTCPDASIPPPPSFQSNRINQSKDSKKLLDNLRNDFLQEHINELLANFKCQYSEIALERILNYHFENCIESFLTDSNHNNQCVIIDFKLIIEEFTMKFPLFNSNLYIKKLVSKINWNTSDLNLSNINLLDPLLTDKCKESIRKIIETAIDENIESIGVCSFDQLLSNDSIKIFKETSHDLLLNQYIILM